MGTCPQATPQHTGEEEEEEEGLAPAAVGLSARLCRSPAASPRAKQPLIKSRAGAGGPPPRQKGDQSHCPRCRCHHGDLPPQQGRGATWERLGQARPKGRVSREQL